MERKVLCVVVVTAYCALFVNGNVMWYSDLKNVHEIAHWTAIDEMYLGNGQSVVSLWKLQQTVYSVQSVALCELLRNEIDERHSDLWNVHEIVHWLSIGEMHFVVDECAVSVQK